MSAKAINGTTFAIQDIVGKDILFVEKKPDGSFLITPPKGEVLQIASMSYSGSRMLSCGSGDDTGISSLMTKGVSVQIMNIESFLESPDR